MENILENQKAVEFLESLGISLFPSNRNYWFVRTQKGTYYEDFINEQFVGIEWDKVSDKELIEKSTEEELKHEVVFNYPNIDKPGYVASLISKFANFMKKGDIVLIPSESSKWICFGELIDDEMYIYDEEEDFLQVLDDFYDDSEVTKEKVILKKRRRVKWIKAVKKYDLDPYLYGIIYSHNAIVDANPYSLYIDRTLSQFYIKGEEAYFTYRVNKRKNIPYGDMLKLLNDNNDLIKLINEHSSYLQINPDELVLKINVQSRGPIQLKGAVKQVLFLGIATVLLFGTAKIDFQLPVVNKDVEIPEIHGLVTAIYDFVNEGGDTKKQAELEKIKANFNEDKQKLQLQLPSE